MKIKGYKLKTLQCMLHLYSVEDETGTFRCEKLPEQGLQISGIYM